MLIWTPADPHSPGQQAQVLCRARAMVLPRVGSASPLALCALGWGLLGQLQPEAVPCLLMPATSPGEHDLENAAIG